MTIPADTGNSSGTPKSSDTASTDFESTFGGAPQDGEAPFEDVFKEPATQSEVTFVDEFGGKPSSDTTFEDEVREGQ